MIFAPDLTLHAITRQQCQAYLRDPRGAVLLQGGFGCGLMTIATNLAQQLNPQPEATMLLQSEAGKELSIEQIRELYHQTRSHRQDHLTVIIDDAESMSIPAQNAFLKLLEEPPSQVVFVLTSHLPNQLLPTILSRLTTIEVRPVTPQESRELLTSKGITDPIKIAQLLFLASGRPAGLLKLINDEAYFAARADMIRIAKNALQGSTYQRLIVFKDYMGDREKASELILTIGNIIALSFKKSAAPKSLAQLDSISLAIDSLASNANVRLQLLRLALAL